MILPVGMFHRPPRHRKIELYATATYSREIARHERGAVSRSAPKRYCRASNRTYLARTIMPGDQESLAFLQHER